MSTEHKHLNASCYNVCVYMFKYMHYKNNGRGKLVELDHMMTLLSSAHLCINSKEYLTIHFT